MPIGLKYLPSPSMGGSGWGWDSCFSPIPTFPPKGGRGIDLSLFRARGKGNTPLPRRHNSMYG